MIIAGTITSNEYKMSAWPAQEVDQTPVASSYAKFFCGFISVGLF